MRRILFEVRSRLRAGNVLAVAVFRIMMIAGHLVLSSQATLAADAGLAVSENPKIDVQCAKRDLELFTLIERNGNNGLSSTATLVETSDMLETARAACDAGNVDDALALYDSALRRLENPSDFARR